MFLNQLKAGMYSMLNDLVSFWRSLCEEKPQDRNHPHRQNRQRFQSQFWQQRESKEGFWENSITPELKIRTDGQMLGFGRMPIKIWRVEPHHSAPLGKSNHIPKLKIPQDWFHVSNDLRVPNYCIWAVTWGKMAKLKEMKRPGFYMFSTIWTCCTQWLILNDPFSGLEAKVWRKRMKTIGKRMEYRHWVGTWDSNGFLMK